MRYSNAFRGFRLDASDEKRIREIIEEKEIELNKSKYRGVEQILNVISGEILETAYEAFLEKKTAELFKDLEKVSDKYKIDFMDQFDDERAKNIAMLYKTIASMSEGNNSDHIKNAGFICYAYALNGEEPDEYIFKGNKDLKEKAEGEACNEG